MGTITHENLEMSGASEMNCCLTATSNYVIDNLNERKPQLREKKVISLDSPLSITLILIQISYTPTSNSTRKCFF